MIWPLNTFLVVPRISSGDTRIETLFKILEEETETSLDVIATGTEGELVRIENRQRAVDEEMKCQNDAVRFICDGSMEKGVHLSLRPMWVSGGDVKEPITNINIRIESTKSRPLVDHLLAKLGDELIAWYGGSTPENMCAFLWGRFARTRGLSDTLAARLRKLPKTQPFHRIKRPEIPGHLHWVNYFSAATSKVLQLPEVVRHQDGFGVCYQTKSGGWIFGLTNDALDLTKEEHVKAVERAYSLFSVIGRR